VTLSLLGLALLLGLRHALEADHVAAVAALVSRPGGQRGVARIACAWAAGHGAVLLVAGGVMCALGTALPERVQRLLELGVGVVMIALGVDALRRTRSFHHSVAPVDDGLVPAPGTASRALLVGALHGLEGSAAVVLVAMPLARSRTIAFAWLALFALATLVAMVAGALALAAPLRLSATARLLGRALPLASGAACVAVGCWVALRAAGS
jgi:hypothetical protein